MLLLLSCIQLTSIAQGLLFGSPTVPRVSEFSCVGCGTWSWGNRLLFDYSVENDEELYGTFKVLRDAGVTLFDTADSYGTLDLNARAETLLGQFEDRYLRERNKNRRWNFPPKMGNDLQVATKFAPYPWRLRVDSIQQAAESSCGRIDRKLALAQAHWSTKNYLPAQESVIWQGLAQSYRKGYCKGVGVSNYGPRQLRAASEFFNQADVPLVTAQTQFSLLTYQQNIKDDYTNLCQELGITCLAYSPLCLGLLTGKYSLDKLPNKGPRRQLFLELLPSAQPLLDVMRAINPGSCSRVAIQWCIQKGTIPLVGCRTPSQARDLLSATKEPSLSQSEMEVLDRAALSVDKPMIANIFQTR